LIYIGELLTLNKQMRNSKTKFTLLSILSFLLVFSSMTLSAQEIDLLLKGGQVIDPKNKINAKMDVAIAGGKIVQVAANIPANSAKKTVDVSGLYVTPGIIDMHAHVFQGNDLGSYIADGQTAVPADAFTFRAGVTTV
jgi:dihydroorotase